MASQLQQMFQRDPVQPQPEQASPEVQGEQRPWWKKLIGATGGKRKSRRSKRSKRSKRTRRTRR